MSRRKLKAVVLDWAGTTVDHGSVAPVLALQALFVRHGIQLSEEAIRQDMGLLKKDHIRLLLQMPDLARMWRSNAGHDPEEKDVDLLFEEFGPLQLEIIEAHSRLIPGVVETVTKWQDHGLKIGTTTGYSRAMLAPVVEESRRSGYRPDAIVCPDDVGAGRPFPWMAFRNLQTLGVYPPSACVKIGDTASDIEEGRNAGMWTIGLLRTGNLVGLDETGWEISSDVAKAQFLERARLAMAQAGADYVAESLVDCESILNQIEDRLA